MGLLDRAWDAILGGYGAAQAVPGYVHDLMRAPFDDDEELNGFINTVFGRLGDRGAQAIESAMGPDRGLGAIVGGLPEGVRTDRVGGFFSGALAGGATGAAGGSVFGGVGALPGAVGGALIGGVGGAIAGQENVQEAGETAFRNTVSRPVSTAMTAGSLAQADSSNPIGEIGQLFRGDTWQEAWSISAERSPGQAIMLAFQTEDVRDSEEVRRAMGTDAYENLSGVFDAVLRFRASPEVLAGHVAMGARTGGLAHATIREAAAEGGISAMARTAGGRAMERFAPNQMARRTISTDPAMLRRPGVVSPKQAAFDAKTQVILDDIHDNARSPAWIRDNVFPQHAQGGRIAAALSSAAEDRELLDLTMRGLLGDPEALARMADQRADLAGQVSRLTGPQETAARLTRAGFELPNSLTDTLDTQLNAETAVRYSRQIDGVFDRVLGSRSQGVTTTDRIAGSISDLSFANVKTKYIQDALDSPPVQAIAGQFALRPGPFISFDTPDGDVELTRLLDHAPVDAARRDDLLSNYLDQTTPGGRRRVFDEARDEVVSSYARKAGLSDDELNRVLSEVAQENRKLEARVATASRSYSAKGRGVLTITDDDGMTRKMALPLWLSQESNYAALPNVEALDRAADRIAKYNKRYRNLPGFRNRDNASVARGSLATRIPEELTQGFYRAWKPSVLFRIGWPLRVISEEQLRIMAVVGVMAQTKGLANAAKDYGVDAFKTSKAVRSVASEIRDLEDSTGYLKSLRQAWGDVGTEQRASWGLRWHEVDGHRVQGARGTPEDGRNLYEQMVAETSRANANLYKAESERLAETRRRVVDHRTFEPTEPEFAARWENAVNNQLRNDPVARKILNGATVDEVVDFLRSPEGRPLLNRDLYKSHQTQGRDLREIVAWQVDEIDDALLSSPELKAKLGRGETLSVNDLQRIEPDQAKWNPINGLAISEAATGTSAFSKMVNETVETVYQALGGKPSHVLSRNRFFDHMYSAEVERLIRLHDGPISDDTIRLMENQARQHALHETRNWMFDLAHESNLAHTLRFVSPFFMAQQEVLTRWAGLTVQNPAYIAKMRIAWRSPEAAGLVVDENGNTISSAGTATSPMTGETVEAGEERYLTLPVPEWASDFPGAALFDNARFNKESLNIAMSIGSGVGTGPIVQVPVNEIVKNRPDLESSVQAILPFGTTQDTLSMILPSTIKRMRTSVAGEDSTDYRNSLLRTYYDMVTDYNLGERDTKPTFAEAEKATQQFWSLRTVASFVMPAAPWFTSPYQTHIDAYRAAQERYRNDEDAFGGATPDEWFLDNYGEEFFALTQNISESVDSIPPTVEGFLSRQEHAELVERYPDLGALIVGAEGAGEFSRAVYEHQRNARLRPGSDRTQRETPSLEEGATRPEVRLGWMKFSKMMDLVDTIRIERGLPNLQVKEAQDLAEIKRAYVSAIAQEHPDWAVEYLDPDPQKAADKINGLRTIAAHPKLSKRPEIATLGTYFKARDLFSRVLEERAMAGGAATLNAAANQDLAMLWSTVVGKMTANDIAFADLHSRYLDRDTPSGTTDLLSTIGQPT